MPVAFVRRLRDLRIKQLQEQHKQQQSQMTNKNNPLLRKGQPIIPSGVGELEDFIDELS